MVLQKCVSSIGSGEHSAPAEQTSGARIYMNSILMILKHIGTIDDWLLLHIEKQLTQPTDGACMDVLNIEMVLKGLIELMKKKDRTLFATLEERDAKKHRQQ